MAEIGSGNGSDFGTGVLDTTGILSTKTLIKTDFQNDVQIVAVQIQTVLGANVYGTFGSVEDRLNDLDTSIATLFAENFSLANAASVSLTAGAGVEEDLYTFSVPASILAPNDILEYHFAGLCTLDSGGDVDMILRIGGANRQSVILDTTSSPLEVNNWVMKGTLAARDSSTAILSYEMRHADAANSMIDSVDNFVGTTVIAGFDPTSAFDFTLRASRAATNSVFSVESGFVRRVPAS